MSRRPFDWLNLVGDFACRAFTLALPSEQVLQYLPKGARLGEQSLTPAGTHPVTFFFYDFYRMEMTIPTPLPNMTYREHVLGVPYVFVTKGGKGGEDVGPLYHMPRLLLDDFWAVTGGLFFWGYPKRLARTTVTEGRFEVSDLRGQAQLALSSRPTGEWRPVAQMPNFGPVQEVLCQPMFTELPAGAGPVAMVHRYDKKWSTATVRPLRASLELVQAYYPGLPVGRHPVEGEVPGLDEDPLGAWELRARLRQSVPYPWSLHPSVMEG